MSLKLKKKCSLFFFNEKILTKLPAYAASICNQTDSRLATGPNSSKRSKAQELVVPKVTTTCEKRENEGILNGVILLGIDFRKETHVKRNKSFLLVFANSLC